MTPYYEDDFATLFHANCLDVLPVLEPVSHCITDPPYARDVYVRSSSTRPHTGTGSTSKLYGGKSMYQLAVGEIGHIDEMLEPVAAEIARLVQRWALVFSDAETTWRWRAAMESAGMRYVRTGAWVKPDPMPQMTGDRPCVGFEPCTITHAQGAMRWNGGGRAALWTHYTAKGSDRPDHPCPKPESLMGELVRQFTDPGDSILDPFAGSGTTLVAAKRFGRNGIGIEMSERFCEVAAKRLQQSALDLWTPTPERRPIAADLFASDPDAA